MRTYSIELYVKERNRRVTYTAESFAYANGILLVCHSTLGNVSVRISHSEELTITQDRKEVIECPKIPISAYA